MSEQSVHIEPLDESLVDSTGYWWLDSLLHYGLVLGAIFQLICIFAVVLIPATNNEKDDVSDDDSDHQVATPTRSESSGRKNKREKKKRR